MLRVAMVLLAMTVTGFGQRTVRVKKDVDNRAADIRMSVARELHRRGSPIPPAFSPTGHWTR